MSHKSHKSHKSHSKQSKCIVMDINAKLEQIPFALTQKGQLDGRVKRVSQSTSFDLCCTF